MLKINNDIDFSFYCDSNEFSGVVKIANKVCNDVNLVIGKTPELKQIESLENLPSEENQIALIFGTVGKSSLIESLQKEGKIDLSNVCGKNEVYLFNVTDNKIIIAGSDKRGTIYGLFHLSELLGVSPLVDWANVLPATKDIVELENQNYISKEPSVRYRGFFINDEWPATGNWCNKNFGGFNAQMYEHVFELLLRLKGNYLWPAMWAARFSDDGPGLANAELADELGVIMGASHHEPCCRAGEEYRYLRGPDSIYGDEWNFRSNEKGITKFWEDGLIRNGKFENVITVGMRGEADTAILKNATLKDNIDLLRDVLKTQNSLIKKHVNQDLQKVPRMLALYKEVEPYFYGDKHTKGLIDSPELEGVTLMLCDDNHGNLRTVPTEKMRAHKGGYGMYYHFDYHGSPYSFEWFNTSYLPKVKEQMTAAYDFGIRELWIVNVGDICTNEFPLSYFLNLAYDYEKYSNLEYTTQTYTKEWINSQFANLSEEDKNDIYKILNGFTKLTHMRRTECLMPNTFHPVNYNEADTILQKAEEILALAKKVRKNISKKSKKDDFAFFSQVYLPACGSMNVFKMQILQGKNHWYASKGIYAANDLVKQIKACLDFDKELIDECDSIENGKWYAEGWSEHFGFIHWNEEENMYPVYMTVEGTRKNRLIAWIEGNETTTCGGDWTRKTLLIDSFKNPNVESAVIKIASGCKQGCEYKLSCDKDWVVLSSSEGNVKSIDSIQVSVNKEKLGQTTEKTANIKLEGTDGHGGRILINIFVDANVPNVNYPQGTYVQTTNYISMEAANYSACSAGFKELAEYGKTKSAMKYFPVTTSFTNSKKAPHLEYNFVVAENANYEFEFYLNPSNPAYKDNKFEFEICVNGKYETVQVVSENFVVGDNQEPWSTDVTNSIRICTAKLPCFAGMNKLKVYPLSPNLVLQKIVIHKSGQKLLDSYLGAPESYRVM